MFITFSLACTQSVIIAHDAAFFDARILHRDISVGNILITDEGKGLLVDWDLCINLNRGNERFCDRPPPRMVLSTFFSCFPHFLIQRIGYLAIHVSGTAQKSVS